MNKRILFAGLLLLVGCAHGTAKKEEARTPNAVNDGQIHCTIRNYDVSAGGNTGVVMFSNTVVPSKDLLVVYRSSATLWVDKIDVDAKVGKAVQVFEITKNGFNEPSIHARKPMEAYVQMTPDGIILTDYKKVSISCKKLDKVAGCGPQGC